MSRPVSPLLHDYKSSTKTRPDKSRSLQWFAIGLGTPLLGIALFLSLQDAASTDYSAANAFVEPLTETPSISLVSVPHDDNEQEPLVEAVVSVAVFHPPLTMTEPEYGLITLTIARGDTLDGLFRKHKLDLGHLAQIARLPDAGKYLRMLKPGDELDIRHDEGKLVSLYRELSLTRSLLISKADVGFQVDMIDRPVETKNTLAYGRIDSSLFESGADAGLSDNLIMNLAGIFAWDVDFVLDIRTGDNYYLIFEEIWQDGEYISDGEIVAAEFNNNGRTFQAIRYVDGENNSDYFTPGGRSVRKAFVRAPVDFTRISSSFNPKRRHPILNTIRAHRGVDYAAPRGTNIMAAGDGKVIFRGVKNGYGNAIILQHGGNITTLYAHMSRFSKSARVGRRVKQGQTIGHVGSTGLATANHLHYEYRLNGVHRNPRTVSLPQAAPIKEKYRQDFLTVTQPIMAELLRYKRTQIASISYD